MVTILISVAFRCETLTRGEALIRVRRLFETRRPLEQKRYFTFILLWSPWDTFCNKVWFDFITNRIQFHYSIRYRKFSLNCEGFKTRKEMKRKNCYVFLKKLVFHMCLPYSYSTRRLLVGVVAREHSLVLSRIFFGIELSFFLKVQRSCSGQIVCFI